jgi:predicted PurR-regulated permease PerM
MSSVNSSKTDDRFLSNAMASFLQIGALLLLLILCLRIVGPFVNIVIWGVVIGVSLYPTHQSLTAKLGGREKLSATILVLIGLTMVITPVWLTAESTVHSVQNFTADMEAGTVTIAPPGENVADWPVIGESVYEIWTQAADNLESTMNEYAPQLETVRKSLTSFAGGVFRGALQFVIAIIIAGTLLMSAESGLRVARNILSSLMGDETGTKMTTLSVLTIRSIVKGVLGIAIFQAVFAAVGLVVMDVPAAGLWAAAVLVLVIVQVPALLVLGPICVWVFSVAEPVPATIFAVYMVLVSMSDMVLKPMLLGRGVDTPMLVILLGAIGGAMTMGIIGLFLGAVILALGYELLVAWMSPDEDAVDA